MAIIEANIIDMRYPNYSIAEYDDKLYRFKGGILGQKVRLKTGKLKAGFYKAKLLEIIEKSPLEINNFCEDPNLCSNCKFQNIDYEKEIEIKEKIINKLYKENGWKESIKLNPSPKKSFYRNKMEYTFGDEYKGGPLVLGNHRIGKFYEIVEDGGCQIANEDFEKIREYTQDFFRKENLDFYHKSTHRGELRFFVIRYSFYQNAYMLNLVTTSSEKINDSLFDRYTKGLNELKLSGDINSLFHTISDSKSDAIKPDKVEKIWGDDFLTEKINGLIFNISPFSFFQPNPVGAQNLYNKALKLAGNIDDKIVYDLYCGTGTISQIFAKKAKKVIGVEIVEEAVEKAKENAKINNLNNTEFYANDVLEELDNLNDNPDIIVIDPPRSGIHKDAIKKICDTNVDKIVYISCNPETQVRDLEIFKESGYNVKNIEAFDQFPRTFHVEALVLMTREN